MFVDEAGFYLLVSRVLTYAPIGQTPILKAPLTRDHFSVIGAITPDGKLYVHIQDKAFNGANESRTIRLTLGGRIHPKTDRYQHRQEGWVKMKQSGR